MEIFKTNVYDGKDAQLITGKLQRILPFATINFDLEDCDKILRIEGEEEEVNTSDIVAVVRDLKFQIEVLE